LNFFEHQDLARRNTRVMVVLYALAVVAVVLAVDVVLAFAYRSLSQESSVPQGLYVWGALTTALFILLVSLFHMLKLREGGAAIARMVGAQRVAPGSAEPLERRLLNVVEEMAIAAGTRVPAVYVMQDEKGINAFAAGYDVSNSVIAVTRGTLEVLNRDELQGIIAHEYSHIVNGDMRLNIRMMGVLSGIVFVGAVGEFLMRSSGRRRSSRDSGSGQIVAIGLALMVIGYVGLFFARLIKAAVSRQREFLADASSVQFTRNPDGIAGALDQIRASSAGTLVANRYAEDLSHMFFGQAVKLRFASIFATHPPLEERIKRVRPGFGPAQYRARRAVAQTADPLAALAATGKRAGDEAHAWGRSIAQSVALVGTLDAKKVDYAQRLLEQVPAPLREAFRARETAPAAVIALLLAQPREVMAQQLAAVQAAAPELAQRAREFAPQAQGLGAEFRLPMVDLALPTLKMLVNPAPFLAAVEAAIHADRRVTLHEFVVLTLLRSQLHPSKVSESDRAVSQLRIEIALLLSLLAHAGTPAEAQRAFRAGASQLGMPDAVLVNREALSFQGAAAALDKLRALAPLAKAELVSALFATLTFDGKVRVSEAELMRVVGASLACPVPPLLDALG
jgi:Zn-dependent protease with chaperone function